MDQFMTAGVELDALRPEIWSAQFYPTLLEALPMNDSVERNYEGEVRALGNAVNVTSFPQFPVAQTIQESQKSDANAITAASTQLVVDQQIVQDFTITDLAMIQTIDAANAIRDLAFFSILKAVQVYLFSLVSPSTSAPDHVTSYASGTTQALADILEAKELLDEADVPDDGRRVMINGSAQWNDIFNITGLTSRDFVDNRAMESGSLPGRVLGFNPKFTTEAGSTAYYFHPCFLQAAFQRGLDAKVYDTGVNGIRAARVNCTLLMGAKQFSNVRVVTKA